MVTKFRSWWQKVNKWLVVGTLISLVIVIVIVLGYWLKWDWTGFNEHIGPNVPQYQPSKTLWDWLQLLGIIAIPIVVGLGTVWFTTQQGKVSDAKNTDNQRETALQAYIDKMSELLLVNHLREATKDEEVRQIARARTLTVLRILNERRKGNVLQFLQEAGLISKDTPVVELHGADLSNAYLNGAKLNGVDLSDAILRDAKLIGAKLNGTVLTGADLTGADLSRAYLGRAELYGAKLNRVDLSRVYLRDANLSEAYLSQEQLEKVKSFQAATMPDGSKHS
jgi:uncharacterized protein YjbI with pentapeptide repeats